MNLLLDVGNPGIFVAIGIGLILAVIVLAIGVVAGIILICRHVYKKRKAQAQENVSDINGDEASKSEE